ncbi:hypothetical protein BDN67DRAFT_976582, partial [Paxillus ammoniavirescens]
HANKMVVTSETHLLGDHSTLGMSLNNVPGAVSEVKAWLVWVQVPSENGVHLELVHRVSSTSTDVFGCLYANVHRMHIVRGQDGTQLARNDHNSVASTPHRERHRLGERLTNAIARCNRGG